MTETDHINFDAVMQKLEPITLDEMDSIKLMNRIDSKFLTHESVLVKVLEDAAAAGYRVLTIGDIRQARYNSTYYDTASYRMFRDHHNRRLVRQKVRTRIYLDSGDAFLEIKRKNNHGRTKKKRIGIPASQMMDFSSNADACAYLQKHSWFTQSELTPAAETVFTRITLVNPGKTERLTIDSNLHFKNFRTGFSTTLEDTVIIELKQDGRAYSPMRKILLDNRVKPVRVSKYCIAVTLTEPSLTRGRFKVKVRRIEKEISKKLISV